MVLVDTLNGYLDAKKDLKRSYDHVYYTRTKDRYSGNRKACSVTYNSEHKEERAAYDKVYRARVKYGLTEEQYLAMPKACQICGETTNLVIDHCHNSNRFRGRLCNKCNLGLGLFNDDVKRLMGAVEYLGQDTAWDEEL